MTDPLEDVGISALGILVITFLFTLQPLALGRVEGGHLVRLAGRPADASAVHSPDPEVVGAAHAQAVHRVFTNLDGGVVALDPGVAAGLAPVDEELRTIILGLLQCVDMLASVYNLV